MYHEDICAAVADKLSALGVKAYAEHTGGWIVCVIIPEASGMWYFGTANEEWGGSLMLEDGTNIDNVETSVSSDSEDVEAITRAIYTAYTEHVRIAVSRSFLLDVLPRIESVMSTQVDDNGELFAEGNRDLYHELQAWIRVIKGDK